MAKLLCLARVAFLAVLASALPAPPAHSQTITATLQGFVRDVRQAVLPGATVTLRERDTGLVRTTTTDAAGSYVLSHLPVGRLRTDRRARGLQDAAARGAPVPSWARDHARRGPRGRGRRRNHHRHGRDAARRGLEVLGRSEHQPRAIAHLPLTGRQAVSLALLVPGVIQRGTSTEEPVGGGGQPRGSGETLVDGVSTELMAVNSIRSTMPPDAVQEFQVITNQYQAEFGNATGVILNTIARSGTNDLHGRLHYFHRDEALDARNAFATTKASFEQKQAGGWLGGPIVRDRTHYFVAYDATRRKQIAL